MHIFSSIADRAPLTLAISFEWDFRFDMCLPYDKAFLLVRNFAPCDLDLEV